MNNKYAIDVLGRKRFDWRLVIGGALITLLVTIIALVANVGGMRNYLCTRYWFRPVCAATNMAIFRFSREDVAWYDASEARSCTGIEQYLAQYPNGKFAQIAASRLSGRRLVEQIDWREDQAEVEIQYTKYLNQHLVKPNPARNLANAKNNATDNAKSQARQVECLPYATGIFKLESVRIKPQTWNCTVEGNGQTCDFAGTAICYYSEKSVSYNDEC
jgi:hypothetical protein